MKYELQISWDYICNIFLPILLKGTNKSGKQKPVICVSAYLKFLKEQQFKDTVSLVLELT